MITLEEACDIVKKKVGDTCGLVSCSLVGDYYAFTVHRRNTGVYEHDAAICNGHFVDKNTGKYRFVYAMDAYNYSKEHDKEKCDPFPFMDEEDVKVAKQIIANIKWAS